MKKGQTYQGDYLLEDSDEFFKLLPYLYPKIEGEWEISVIDPTIKALRQIYATDVPNDLRVNIYADSKDIAQFQLERPDITTEKVSNWTLYQELFRDIDKVFEPKAVNEIYSRAGPDIDNLKQALTEVLAVSEGNTVTVKDVDKVLLSNKRVYANEVIRAFIGPSKLQWRWQLLDWLREELGDDYAFYAMRKYVRALLLNKNKYLRNEEVADRFARDVKEIDALTIDYTYSLFVMYDKPLFIPAIFYKLERRIHT